MILSMESKKIKILVLCTIQTGLDSVAEIIRNGYQISAIVGVSPNNANLQKISGWTDISKFASKWKIPYIYVDTYELNSEEDRRVIEFFKPNIIYISGWQRLVPKWLIELPDLGILGAHGSPDGILRGRGRSPQNWAIMLGCKRFDLALFKITPGMDDGPIVAQQSFYYYPTDDILISYKKASLCLGKMVCEVLGNPFLLQNAVTQQEGEALYFPQRKPEDGYADWNLPKDEIWAHCRALSKPYPGLKTRTINGNEFLIWDCLPFDEVVEGAPGQISFLFEDNTFLVNASDGRIIVRNYSFSDEKIILEPGMMLLSVNHKSILNKIISRHQVRYPNHPISFRVLNKLNQ